MNELIGDGVQAVTCDVPGWTFQAMPTLFDTARDANRWVSDQIDYWLRYTGPEKIGFVYYGYDPIVHGEAGPIGTDGYPDKIGKVTCDEHGWPTITWEDA